MSAAKVPGFPTDSYLRFVLAGIFLLALGGRTMSVFLAFIGLPLFVIGLALMENQAK